MGCWCDTGRTRFGPDADNVSRSIQPACQTARHIILAAGGAPDAIVAARVAKPTHSMAGVEADARVREALRRGRTPAREPAAGSVLGGKYRLISEIGRGGMGSVWRAEHQGWGAPVAVKLMSPELSSTPEALTRFEREVRLAAGLRSPHVVQVLDHGIDDETGAPFIVMELLEGQPLSRRLKQVNRLSPAETFRIVSHLVRALSRAHAAGIVHRDLKPDNVFLVRNDEESVAKVLDFGVAKWTAPSTASFESGLTRPGSVVGTPFYMSPEQIQGSVEVDHRADLWSLSAIACECLTGRRPFEARDFAQLAVMLVGNSGRRLPSELGPVPPGFDAWFAKATASDINRRFQSARDLLDTLAPVCGVSPASVPPESLPFTQELPAPTPLSTAAVSHTTSPFGSRRPWRGPLARVALITALSSFALVGGGAALWYGQATSSGPRAGKTADPQTKVPGSGGTPKLDPPTSPGTGGPGVRILRDNPVQSDDPARLVTVPTPSVDHVADPTLKGTPTDDLITEKPPREPSNEGGLDRPRDVSTFVPDDPLLDSGRSSLARGQRPPKGRKPVGAANRPPAGRNARTAGVAQTGPTPSTVESPVDAPTEGVDVNGRRIRTSLSLTP
jgi:serine/threonine protein kinase